MTRESPFMKGYWRLFGSPSEVRAAYDAGELHLQASIRCRVGVWDPHQNVDEDLPIRREIFATTTGRMHCHRIGDILYDMIRAPQHNLQAFQAKTAAGQISVTRSARTGADEVGLGVSGIAATIAAIRLGMFYKSMESDHNPGQ